MDDGSDRAEVVGVKPRSRARDPEHACREHLRDRRRPALCGQLDGPADLREAKKGLAEGTLDIVVGTHALLGKAIAFKEAYDCDGVSTRQHNEPAGNQDVWHLHTHVFPRFVGDRLYERHEETTWTTPAERAPYAAKLRAVLEP